MSVTRKLSVPLAEDMALEVVRHLARLPITQIDIPLILAAISRSRSLQLSFWDALIVEAALGSGAASLFSEDLQFGQQIDGLQVENPFL